jgi:MYXO-CTERM domain-containing protein
VSPRLPTLLGTLALVAAAAGAATTATAKPDASCPTTTLSFGEPEYVDQGRAGGEPIVFTYPDGTLLYGSHAGTTHFYSPAAGDPTTAAFGQNYKGQTYYWYSTSNGGEWSFVDRTLPPGNDPMSGFSDPEFAYDTAGNVYVSEINLVNVAVSKSSDKGRSYKLQNATANVFTDRQWTEGDTENVLYLVGNPTGPGGTYSPGQTGYQVNSGHTIYKSVDGGKTFTPGFKDPGGFGDIRVDKRNGTVYEAHMDGNELTIAAFRDARQQDFKTLVEPDVGVVADDVHMLSHWPAFDLDPDGNLYVTWDENGKGDREAGVYYTYSTDAGRHWAAPVRVDGDEKTDIWPWLGVGDDGKVGIAWLEADKQLPNEDAETQGTYGWRLMGATTVTGLGCHGRAPAFTRALMTKQPMHTGTVCMGGTTCQATATDRRLGDYFSVDVTRNGMLYAGYSDTRQGGAISLPAFVRQNAGTPLVGTSSVTPPHVTPPKRQTAPRTTTRPRAALPTTGADLAWPALAGLLGIGAYAARRRRA